MGQPPRTIRNCPVAVIGGAGFLGSHLVDHLIADRGCEVLVLDNLISGHRKFINPKATFVWFDIRDSEDALEHLFREHRVEYVFNYAAEPYIPVSFARPLHVVNINAFAAMKVLNAAHDAGVNGILQVSSAEIYGESDGKISELSAVVPHSTYGVSKVAADGFVQVRWREAKTPAIAMRQFNVVGARETHPYVVPEIITQVFAGKGRVTVKLGNNSFRDFQNAKDAVRMAVELLEYGQFGEVYNMGSESGIKIYDLAKTIGEIAGVEVEVVPDEARMRPWEIWHLMADNSKLYSSIPYRPQYTLTDSLTDAVRYYEQNNHRWDFQ